MQSRWSSSNRAGSRTLSEREAHDIARDVHDGWLTRHRDEPIQQTFWSLEVGKKVFAPPASIDMDKFGTPEFWTLDPDIGRITTLQDWCIGYADHELRARGLIVDDGSRHKLAKAIAAAVQKASEVLARLSKGEIEPSSQSSVHVSQAVSREAAVSKPAKTVSFDNLVKGWSAEKKPALKTVYEWSRSIRDFTEFLGSTDAISVTPDDVQAWKEALIVRKLTAKTIRDSKLVAVRSIMQWGVANRRLHTNLAEKISMDVTRKASDRGIRSFTDEEATLVLKAALTESNPVLRWVPWLCAYSGALYARPPVLRGDRCGRVPARGQRRYPRIERTVVG